MNTHDLPNGPSPSLLIRELRVIPDLLTLPLSFVGMKEPVVQTSPVIVLPGFGAGEGTMRPLRTFLRRQGFAVHDWGLGVNKAGLDIPHDLDDLGPTWPKRPLHPYRREGGVAFLTDRMVENVLALYEQANTPVSLVGWSLGGTIAREVARDVPWAVKQVVTLGSPFIGGPKYTAAANRLRNSGLNLDWIEEQAIQREVRPVKVPITALVSPTDGIVDFRAAFDHHSEDIEHIQIDVAHLSMGFNRKVWKQVLTSLRGRH